MREDRVDEICDKCKKPINILVKDFEAAMKAGEPVLCPECASEYMDEQTGEMPKRCFKYLVGKIDTITMNVVGKEGWELVNIDNGIAYFKQEYIEES